MNQHDNVMGDPDYMAAFLHEVPDAFIDVVSHDMILTVRKNYIDGVEKALKNIPDQVTLGHEGDFPIITAKIDETLDDYIEYSTDSDANPAFQYGQRANEALLMDAYSKGIWAPKFPVSVGGVDMIPRPSSEAMVPRVVKGDVFKKWFERHYIESLLKDIKRWESSNTPGSSKKRLVERLVGSKGRQGFMKIGKEY